MIDYDIHETARVHRIWLDQYDVAELLNILGTQIKG